VTRGGLFAEGSSPSLARTFALGGIVPAFTSVRQSFAPVSISVMPFAAGGTQPRLASRSTAGAAPGASVAGTLGGTTKTVHVEIKSSFSVGVVQASTPRDLERMFDDRDRRLERRVVEAFRSL
jgi:hypothetical protein